MDCLGKVGCTLAEIINILPQCHGRPLLVLAMATHNEWDTRKLMFGLKMGMIEGAGWKRWNSGQGMQRCFWDYSGKALCR